MAKLTEYPQATAFDNGDILIKDGVNGTKKILVSDAFKDFKPMSSSEISALGTLLDMPLDRCMAVTSTRLTELISTISTDNEYPVLPTSSTTYYYVRNYKYTGSYRAFEVIQTTGNRHFFATTAAPHPNTLTWFDRSWNDLNDGIAENKDSISILKKYNSVDLFAGHLKTVSSSTSHGVRYSWANGVWTVRNVDMSVPSDAAGLYTIIETESLPDYIKPGKTYYLIFNKEIYLAEGESENDTFGYDNVVIQFRFNNGSTNKYVYVCEKAAIVVPEDAVSWTVSIYVDNSMTVSCKITDISLLNEKPNSDISNKSEDENVFECYTDFEKIKGWYTEKGCMASPNLWHTQRMRIRPDTDYYSGYLSGSSTLGAFYDEDGYYIGTLRGASTLPGGDISAVRPSYGGEEGTYYPDNASLDPLDLSSYKASSYITLMKFHTPKNAAYFSLNMSNATATKYKQYICSKEMYVANGTGNMVIKANDPFYQKYKDKRLCLIGPSSVMVNRLSRTRTSGTDRYIYKYEDGRVEDTVTTGYIAGFQEYLKPYFAEVKSYGYSGHAWAYGRGDQSHKASIYTWLMGGTETFPHLDDGVYVDHTITAGPNDIPDLSCYDVYIFLTNSNGLSRASISADTVPDFNSATTYYVGDYVNYNSGTYKFTVHHDPGAWNSSHVEAVSTIDPKTTYVGAITEILDHIINVNPRAEIYFSTSRIAGLTGTTRETRILVNEKISELAVERGYGIIDGLKGNTSNTVLGPYLSYDGKHSNCHGMLRTAYSYRKDLIGF